MAKTIENLFSFLGTYSPVLPPFLLIILTNVALKSKVLRVVSLYSLIELFTNLAANEISPKGIIFLYSVFTVFEYALFAWVFYLLIENSRFKNLVVVASLLFAAFWIIYKLYGKHQNLDSIPIGVETILILTFAFIFLFEQVENLAGKLLYQRYSFWITSGILIYLAGSFFSYLFSNELDERTLAFFWTFTNICSTFKNVLFLIAIGIYNRDLSTISRPRSLAFKSM